MSRAHAPVRALLVVALLASALLGGCGAQTSITHRAAAPVTSVKPPAATKPPPNTRSCLGTPSEIVESTTGAINGCVRLPALAGGRYTVSLQTDLDLISGDGIREKEVAAAKRALFAPGPPVSVSLSPDAGPPGTVVTVTVRSGREISHHKPGCTRSGGDAPQFFWDGFPQGLMLQSSCVRWTSDRSFTVRVTVPAVPWVEQVPDVRILGTRSGSYPIDVKCVGPGSGCSDAAADGSATFRLEVKQPPSWCRTASSCADLTASPAIAPPGAAVRLGGHLPLIGFVSYTPEFTRGRPSGPAARITPGNARVAAARFGRASLEVTARPGYAQLGSFKPAAVLAGGLTPIASDPADPAIVAWCASGAIELSVDGVRSTIGTAGAKAVAKSEGMYAPAGEGPLSCVDVMPLSRSTVLAAFEGETEAGSGVFADYAAQTTDGGRSWKALPVPPGSVPAAFGGFRASGSDAEAVYARYVKSRYRPELNAARPVVERSGDAGVTWTPANLACPPRGPCVTFGPFLPGNCAQGLSTQYVLRSTDGGSEWREAPVLERYAYACGESQLATLGPTSKLLIDALSTYPLQRTTDAGASWQSVTMPYPDDLEVVPTDGLGDFGPGGITLLPDGALLLTGGGAYKGGWLLLRPGAEHWCAVAGYTGTWQFKQQASVITPIGHELWWLTYGTAKQGVPARIEVNELPLGKVVCATTQPAGA